MISYDTGRIDNQCVVYDTTRELTSSGGCWCPWTPYYPPAPTYVQPIYYTIPVQFFPDESLKEEVKELRKEVKKLRKALSVKGD